MQLTKFTDYALRTMVFLAVNPDRTVPMAEISKAYGISHNHLIKVVQTLVREGYVVSERGRSGGLRLVPSAVEARIGDLVAKFEPDMDLLECFSPDTSHCPLTPACRLKTILHSALQEFMNELNRYTLADMLRNREQLEAMLMA